MILVFRDLHQDQILCSSVTHHDVFHIVLEQQTYYPLPLSSHPLLSLSLAEIGFELLILTAPSSQVLAL